MGKNHLNGEVACHGNKLRAGYQDGGAGATERKEVILEGGEDQKKR